MASAQVRRLPVIDRDAKLYGGSAGRVPILTGPPLENGRRG